MDGIQRPTVRLRSQGANQQARTTAILRAALEEVAEVGYAALSIDTVASRVGIAKTTIYRRYPTKLALVQAALMQLVDESFGEQPDSGSLRSDLVALGLQVVRFASSVIGQGLCRISLLDRSVAELEEIAQNLEKDRRERGRVIAARAIARNEIANEPEFLRVVEMLAGAILWRSGVRREAVGELDVVRMVDTLLHGVSPGKPPRIDPTRAARNRPSE